MIVYNSCFIGVCFIVFIPLHFRFISSSLILIMWHKTRLKETESPILDQFSKGWVSLSPSLFHTHTHTHTHTHFDRNDDKGGFSVSRALCSLKVNYCNRIKVRLFLIFQSSKYSKARFFWGNSIDTVFYFC